MAFKEFGNMAETVGFDEKMAHHLPVKTNISPPREIAMISTVQDEPLFKNKVFLQHKYLSEGLSASQIAREISSARSTVSFHLTELEIENKKNLKRGSKGQLGFGERFVKGRVIPHKGELAIIEEMLTMRSNGASYGQIASWLNDRGIPTKNRASKWARPTILGVLRRYEDGYQS